MTNGEVAAIRHARKAASGDFKATQDILDRIMGKPKQSVESTTTTLNYLDYLDYLAEHNPPPDDNAQTIDIYPQDNYQDAQDDHH